MIINTAYLLETLKKSIAINSITPHEQALAEFFAKEIRSLGLEPEWHEVAPGRPNVYVTADLGASDDMLLLTGHLDTVDIAANWLTNPLEAVEKDGKLYGLGSFDMKSGLVCAFAAFKALVEDKSLSGKLGKIAFAATVDEEAYGLGAKALLETKYRTAKGILLTEPFWGQSLADSQPTGLGTQLPIGLTGKILYKLTFEGKMAHGFYPEKGINAVEEAGKLLAALDTLSLFSHELYGQGNYSTLKIEGGYKEYAVVVPERCEVIISRLTVPSETKESVLRDMQELVDSLALASRVTIEILDPYYDAYLIDTNTHFANCFNAAYTQEIKSPAEFAFMKGITDANIYVTQGDIATVTFGPRGNGAHECNEYVEIDSLEPVAKVLADTCIRYYAKD